MFDGHRPFSVHGSRFESTSALSGCGPVGYASQSSPPMIIPRMPHTSDRMIWAIPCPAWLRLTLRMPIVNPAMPNAGGQKNRLMNGQT